VGSWIHPRTRTGRATPNRARWSGTSSSRRCSTPGNRRAWAASLAHYRRASQLQRSNVRLGLPVVVLSAVVGTSLFATLGEERLPMALRIIVGTVSVAAAVLAAVQTFFGFAQRGDQHVLAAD
jgi:hypothetical protein